MNNYEGVRTGSDTSSSAFVDHVNKKVLENYQPNTVFSQFAEPPIQDKDADNIVWAKFPSWDLEPQDAQLQDGITGNEQEIIPETISAQSKQYGIYVTLTDVLVGKALFNMIMISAKNLGETMAKIIDRVFQNEVTDNATKRLYASTTVGGTRAANRAALSTSHKVFAYDIGICSTYLEGKNAPKINGSYVGMLHPFSASFLTTESSAGGLLAIRQYTKAGQKMIYQGELGMIHNVRLVQSSNVKKYNSTVNVYPITIVGRGAYGGTSFQGLKTIIKPFGSSGTEDPYNQRMTVAVKRSMATKILQQDGIIVLEAPGVVI